MVLDVVGQPGVEVSEVVQIEQTVLENIQLGAYVEHHQTQKIVDARVRDRCKRDRHGLADERDLEKRALYLVKKVRLQQQRFARVCDVRPVSHRIPEARWYDENDTRQSHHDTAELDDHTGDSRLLDHGVPLQRRFRLGPVVHNHIHERLEFFAENNKCFTDVKPTFFREMAKSSIIERGADVRAELDIVLTI